MRSQTMVPLTMIQMMNGDRHFDCLGVFWAPLHFGINFILFML